MANFVPPRLSWSDIREKAEHFRQKYVNPPELVPVPIIEIVELNLQLGIKPIPRLRAQCDLEAFLEKNLKEICIDQDLYMDFRQEKRLRFTLAHEVGHLVLHNKEIESADFKDAEEWKKYRINLKEDDNAWFEWQAHEFAGRLLVPKQRLVNEIEKNSDKILMYREMAYNSDNDKLKEAISRVICNVFEVSAQVIYKRINTEQIWESLNL